MRVSTTQITPIVLDFQSTSVSQMTTRHNKCLITAGSCLVNVFWIHSMQTFRAPHANSYENVRNQLRRICYAVFRFESVETVAAVSNIFFGQNNVVENYLIVIEFVATFHCYKVSVLFAQNASVAPGYVFLAYLLIAPVKTEITEQNNRAFALTRRRLGYREWHNFIELFSANNLCANVTL